MQRDIQSHQFHLVLGSFAASIYILIFAQTFSLFFLG